MSEPRPADASPRPYRMRKRREDIEETRQRIVEAAVRLHGSVGPARTTISAVAEEAGVQRSTVYRHFEDEAALFGACTSHWLAEHPWPRPADWVAIEEPRARLVHGLREVYGYYQANEAMLANSYRDIEVMPPFVGELMRAQVEAMHTTLVEAWPGGRGQRDLRVAVRVALDFRTWQSLAGAQMEPRAAAELMASMVASVAE